MAFSTEVGGHPFEREAVGGEQCIAGAAEAEGDAGLLGEAGEAAEHAEQQVVGSEQIALQSAAAAFELGEFEDRAEEAEQTLARAFHRLDIAEIAAVPERTEGLLPHHVGKADDVVERRADIMAQVGEEGGLGPAARPRRAAFPRGSGEPAGAAPRGWK